MILLRALANLVKLFNSETSSRAIALALGLGMVLGLVPLLSLQGILVIAVILFFRVNITAAFLTFGLFKLAALPFAGLFDAIGVKLIEIPALQGLWAWLYNSPVLWMLETHKAMTVGRSVVALALFVPVFLLSRILVDVYRARFERWWASLSFVGAFRATRLYQFYLWIDSPY